VSPRVAAQSGALPPSDSTPRDGDHLLCYSQTDGAFTLHVWRFTLGRAASHLASAPLFCTAAARLEARRTTVEGLFGGDERVTPLRLTICETADGQALVVHGCECPAGGGGEFADGDTPPRSQRAASEEEEVGSARNYVTVLPPPWRVAPALRPAARASHFSYVTVWPHPPFQAALCVHPGCLLLPTGEGLLAVRLADACAPQAPHAPQLDGVGESPLRWMGAQEDGETEETADWSPSEPAFGTRLRCSLACRFEADKYVSRVMAAPLHDGWRLVDLDARVIAVEASPPVGGTACALLLILAALRRGDAAATQPCRPVALIARLACAGGGGGSLRLLRSTELRPLRPGSLGAVASARSAALRRSTTAPMAAHALPHAVDNVSVLARWRSAAAMRHASLPIAILGFGVAAQAAGAARWEE